MLNFDFNSKLRKIKMASNNNQGGKIPVRVPISESNTRPDSAGQRSVPAYDSSFGNRQKANVVKNSSAPPPNPNRGKGK
jgi:predicted small lipoprotein YifL